jgi:hypothetical protein
VLAGAAGAGALVEAGATVVMTAAGAGAGVVVTTQMGLSGTTLVVHGMITVTVASLQVVAGSSQLVQISVVVQSRGTHSVAVQVTVAVHQSHLGRPVADLGGGYAGAGGGGAGLPEGAGAGAGALEAGAGAALPPAAAMPAKRRAEAEAARENFIFDDWE